jgi:hypothetical protein
MSPGVPIEATAVLEELTESLKEIRKERDRYRAALVHIADSESGGWGNNARAALYPEAAEQALGRDTEARKAQNTVPAPAEQPVIVLGSLGELLERLEQLSPGTLAEIHVAITEQQASLKDAKAQVDDELRRRLEFAGRKLDIYGEYEVALESTRESVWDPDDTEAALRQLVDDGVLHAGELTGVIHHEIRVSRTQINKVLGRLSGSPKMALERCRVWRDKGQPRVRVTRSVALIPEENQ